MSRLSGPAAFGWSLLVSAAVVGAVAACAAPRGLGGGIPRAPSAMYDALRYGYEAAPKDGERQAPLADIRDQVV